MQPPRSPILDPRLTVKVFLDMRRKLSAKGQSYSNGGELLRRIEKTCGHPGWFWELLTLDQRTALVGIAEWWEENPYANDPVRSCPLSPSSSVPTDASNLQPNGSQLLNTIGATHLDALPVRLLSRPVF